MLYCITLRKNIVLVRIRARTQEPFLPFPVYTARGSISYLIDLKQYDTRRRTNERERSVNAYNYGYHTIHISYQNKIHVRIIYENKIYGI